MTTKPKLIPRNMPSRFTDDKKAKAFVLPGKKQKVMLVLSFEQAQELRDVLGNLHGTKVGEFTFGALSNIGFNRAAE